MSERAFVLAKDLYENGLIYGPDSRNNVELALDAFAAAERTRLLARLGDEDVRAAVLEIVHEHQPWKSVGPETVQAVTSRVLARVRALLEKP